MIDFREGLDEQRGSWQLADTRSTCPPLRIENVTEKAVIYNHDRYEFRPTSTSTHGQRGGLEGSQDRNVASAHRGSEHARWPS